MNEFVDPDTFQKIIDFGCWFFCEVEGFIEQHFDTLHLIPSNRTSLDLIPVSPVPLDLIPSVIIPLDLSPLDLILEVVHSDLVAVDLIPIC